MILKIPASHRNLDSLPEDDPAVPFSMFCEVRSFDFDYDPDSGVPLIAIEYFDGGADVVELTDFNNVYVMSDFGDPLEAWCSAATAMEMMKEGDVI